MRAPLAAVLASALAVPAAAEVTLEGIDVYGTARLSAEAAKARYGRAIEDFVRLQDRSAETAAKAAVELRQRTESQIRKDLGFAWVKLSWNDYFAGGKRLGFMTIDVVEAKDRASRMAFRKAPSRSLPDPGGLLAAWREYMDLGWAAFKRGEISTNHDACLSYFCQWGAQTPELRAFEERFVKEARERKEALVRVLRGERDAAGRAASVFLLTYLPDANESAKLIAEALEDPAVEVRSAALQVYADYAVYHKEVFLPVLQIQAALDYPSAEDRNKALAVIAGMAGNPVHRRFLISKAAPQVLHLLQQNQPATQDTAYAALGILAKEAFDRRDIVSWQRWLERAQAEVQSSSEPVEPPSR